MLTGKDDLTKGTQIGALIGRFKPSGGYRSTEIGVSDGIRTAGKDSVISTYSLPHDPYGFFLNNQTVKPEEGGENVSAFDAHAACFSPQAFGSQIVCDRN